MAGGPYSPSVIGLNCGYRPVFPQKTFNPITKPFALVSLLGVAREQRTEFVFDIRVFHHVFPKPIQPRAGGVAAEPDLVSAGGFADKGDFSHVGTGATVRAACRADNDFLARKTD